MDNGAATAPSRPVSSSEKKRRRIVVEDDSSGPDSNAVQPSPPSIAVQRRYPGPQPLSLDPRKRMQGVSTQHLPPTDEEKEAEEQRQLAEGSPSMLDDDFVEEGKGEDEDEGNDVEEAMVGLASTFGSQALSVSVSQEQQDQPVAALAWRFLDDQASYSGEDSDGDEEEDDDQEDGAGSFIVDDHNSISGASKCSASLSSSSSVVTTDSVMEIDAYVAQLELRNQREGFGDDDTENELEEDDDEIRGELDTVVIKIGARLQKEVTWLSEKAQAGVLRQQQLLEEEEEEEEEESHDTYEEGDDAQLEGNFARCFAYGFSNDACKRDAVLQAASKKAWYHHKKEKEGSTEGRGRGRGHQGGGGPVDSGGGGLAETMENNGGGKEEEGQVALEYVLNPSSIAEYFSSHQCQRYLVIDCLREGCSPATFLAASGGLLRNKKDFDPFRPVTYLECELGKEYEEEVLNKIRGKHNRAVRLWKATALQEYVSMCADVWNEKEIHYLYQASLSVQDVGLGVTERATVHGPTTFKPDLIEVSFRRQEPEAYAHGQQQQQQQFPLQVHLKLIEIKAAERILPKHRVQLGLYALMFERWLAEEGNIPAVHRGLYHMDTTTAGVWLLDAQWYEPTDVCSQSLDLSTFLRTDLVRVLERPEDARSCGSCRVCMRMVRAMKVKHGGGKQERLFGCGGNKARPEDVIFSGMMSNHDMGLVQELCAKAWPGEEGMSMPRTLRGLVDRLPRLCNLYVAGPFNDPCSTQWSIQGVEVEGDAGWSFQIIDDAAIQAVVLAGAGAPRTALVVCHPHHGRIMGVMDFEGKWMVHNVIQQDFWIKDMQWQKEAMRWRHCRVCAVDVEACLYSLITEPQLDSEEGDDEVLLPLMHAGGFVALSVCDGTDPILCPVVDKDADKGSLIVSLSAPILDTVVGVVELRVCSALPVQLNLRLRSIAIIPLKRPLNQGDSKLYVQAPLPGLEEGQAGMLELTLGESEQQRVSVPYISWNREECCFVLGTPLELPQGLQKETGASATVVADVMDDDSLGFGSSEDKENRCGDLLALPVGAIVKVQECGPWGRCIDKTVMGTLQLRRTSNGLLYAYVLLNKAASGDIVPFLMHKVTLRNASCAFAADIFTQFSSAALEAPAASASAGHNIDAYAVANRAAGDGVKVHAHNDMASLFEAALLRTKLRSLLDGEMRLLDETETRFAHLRPDVEILLTGVANRFLALPKENHFVCVSISVRLRSKGGKLHVRRFSSLENEEWESLDGHHADCFFIVVLFHFLKMVEGLNKAAGHEWARQLSLQVYTYDEGFANAIRGMLAKFFCCEGGLAGPRGGRDIEGEDVSLWDMAQYLCLVLAPTSMGILSNGLLQPATSNSGTDDDEAQEKLAVGRKGAKKGDIAFCRTIPIVCLVAVVRKSLAFASNGEEPYSMEAVLHALEMQHQIVKASANNEERKRGFTGRFTTVRLLEDRIRWGKWESARKGKVATILSYDRTCIAPRERVVWRIIGALRRTLHFLQDGVTLNHAPRFPSACRVLHDSTLARLVFMVQNEVALRLNDAQIERKRPSVVRLAQELGAQLRLICCFTPSTTDYSSLTEKERREILEVYFKPQPVKLRALLRHLFPASPVDLTERAIVDYILTHYNGTHRAAPIETFAWTWNKRTTRYGDLTERRRRHYIFQVVGGKHASALWGNDFILTEASASGRQAMTTFRDDVMSFSKYVASSISPAATVLPSRRYAWCTPTKVPDAVATLLESVGQKVDAYICVKEMQDGLITQKATWKDKLGKAGGVLPQEGWSLLRDRASFLELDGAKLLGNPASAAAILQDWLATSQANYTIFEPVSGYTLSTQCRHLQSLALSGEEGMLIQMMRDPIQYNTRFRPSLLLPLVLNESRWQRLTERQRAAACKIRDMACTIVRGPPGTGKTEFIASLILSIQTSQGQPPVAVGITASQRSGIATLINRVAREKERYPIDKERFVLVAVGSLREVWENWNLHPDVHCFTRPELKQQSFKILMGKIRDTSRGGRVLVLAGTPSQLQNLPKMLDERLSAKKRQAGQVPRLFNLDLLVVDEASQMSVTAASCAVQLLQCSETKKHGHAVFVGDEHQLPPIMKGVYTERSLAHQCFYTDFASCLRSCANCDQIPAHALCMGASSFNRGLVLELLAPWDVAGKQPGPQAKLLRAGNGLYVKSLLLHQGKVFGSFLELVQAIGVVGGRFAGEDLATMGTADASRHFFQVDMDVLPIERSVFECLHMASERAVEVRGRTDDHNILVQLGDTFRMNHLLSLAFQHVYQAERSGSTHAADLQFAAVPRDRNGNKEGVLQVDMGRIGAFLVDGVGFDAVADASLLTKLQTILAPSSCLVTVELQGLPDSMLINPHPKGPESLLATLVVHALMQGWSPVVPEIQFMRRHCFLNTPKNKQRRALLKALQDKMGADAGTWNVATVDKMQGQEADCVLSLYAYSDATIATQPGFVYSRNRINVALSRAKCKAVLVLTDQMLKLRPSILAEDPAIEVGYTMFRHIHQLCAEGRSVGGVRQEQQRAVRVVLSEREMARVMEKYGGIN